MQSKNLTIHAVKSIFNQSSVIIGDMTSIGDFDYHYDNDGSEQANAS